MLDVVLAGGSLERVAELAAGDVGGTVAVVVPQAGVAVAWPPQPDSALAALRRYAGQRLGGEPAAVPDGLALELPVVSGRDELGLVALLGSTARYGDGRLHLAAATTVVALALDGPSPSVGAALVEDLLDGVSVPEVEIVARARRAGPTFTWRDRRVRPPAGPPPPRRGRDPAGLPRRAPAAARRWRPRAPARPVTDAALRLAERLPAFALAPFELDPERLGAALREAAIAAGAVEAGATTAADALGGSFRLLVRLASEQPGELRRFAASTIGPLEDARCRDAGGVLRPRLQHERHGDRHLRPPPHGRLPARPRPRSHRPSPFNQADRERLGLGLKARALL